VSLAFLFPGQGSQQPGMLRTLPQSSAVDATLRDAEEVLAELGVVSHLDGISALRNTTSAQLALVIAGVATARALTDERGLRPAFVAGHSVGAFAAAVTAGVLTLREALTVVRLRGDLMRQACADRAWGMAAVTGVSVRIAKRIVEDTATATEPLWLANVNTATQSVICGTSAALDAASDVASRLGARSFERLDVEVASHCPLQAGTAARLREHLSGIPRRSPSVRYLTTTGGRSVAAAEPILNDLAAGVAQTVLWHDAARLMPELGVTCAVEMRPGHVLSRLNSTNAPMVTTISLQDAGIDVASSRARKLSDPLQS
jgi:malonate decarboxylase epsilon subunit